MHSISSLPMPRAGTDSDDDDDSALGLVMDRSTASSTVSLQPDDQTEALTRTNVDLRRRLAEAEKTLQNRLLEHDSELEEFQGRLEEMRSELSATKREEKELRSKEVGNL
jgi:predicted RNase H-like nuclease (RuvC/YqgF family)